MVGLGRMGGNMSERLVRAGHQVVGYDPFAEARERVRAFGAEAADSVIALVGMLETPRIVWLMVPAGDAVDQTLGVLQPLLGAGDIVLDGGNSFYKDSQRRAASLSESRIGFIDVGTSGGIWGLSEGYSLMIGGDAALVRFLAPIFEALAPAANRGWARVGPAGAGHFVKMVHNGIEYGLMQAYAEGFELLRRKEEFELDLHAVAEAWRHGSVVRSWLLDLIAASLGENPTLEGLAAYVADSGEGRWTAMEAIELGCPIPAIGAALNTRFRSQNPAPFAEKLLASLRHKFGGHPIKLSD
jgi:6-phosphogluconate dehydrogenase